MRSRPQPVTAAILLALFSVLNLVFPFFPIEVIPAVALYLVLCWALLAYSAPLVYGCSESGASGSPLLCVCLTSGMQRQG
jgi:hypothetical protein